MPVSVRSFAKINLGLAIGAKRDDGFHELRTIYQTIALCDIVRVDVGRGTGIEIRSKHPGVPCDETNTCWRMAERVMKTLKQRGKVVIQIEKNLPVQGGIGGGSSNAVATLFGLEQALRSDLGPGERLRMAAEVGSDLPLFLVGGTVLGCGRGEEVYPLPDLPPIACVIATPAVAVSTPEAFRQWDQFRCRQDGELTPQAHSNTISEFSRSAFGWLSGTLSGVPAAVDSGEKAKSGARGDRAETLLLDLVRAGIENDFERVVFPMYPELREVKRLLERNQSSYASLSGSGSTVYGLYPTAEKAEKAAEALRQQGVPALATSTLARAAYLEQRFV
jgi:4-diphosphocytidyl-2-C-methyl-D-erythritol kinase